MRLIEQFRSLVRLAVTSSRHPITKIAEKAGISRQTIYDILNGDSVSLTTASDILEACETPVALMPLWVGYAAPKDILERPKRWGREIKKQVAEDMFRSGQTVPQSLDPRGELESVLEREGEYINLLSDVNTSGDYGFSRITTGQTIWHESGDCGGEAL